MTVSMFHAKDEISMNFHTSTHKEKDNNSISAENSADRSYSSPKRTRSSSRHTNSNTEENVFKKSKSSSSSWSSSNNTHVNPDLKTDDISDCSYTKLYCFVYFDIWKCHRNICLISGWLKDKLFLLPSNHRYNTKQ